MKGASKGKISLSTQQARMPQTGAPRHDPGPAHTGIHGYRSGLIEDITKGINAFIRGTKTCITPFCFCLTLNS
jgi:hypothetical protein